MSDRITKGKLRAMAAVLNADTESPVDDWIPLPGGKMVARVGNFHVTFADSGGGACLRQMTTVSGESRDVFGCGFISKRELFYRMHAFADGVKAGRSIQIRRF